MHHLKKAVPIELTGVGFFDLNGNQEGCAPNILCLHPILSMQIDQ